MPYYYLISEVPDEPSEPLCVKRKYKVQKPKTYDLLLPSIHSSRTDNVLLTDSDAQEAVDALKTSCKDAVTWPSSSFTNKEDPSVDSQSSVEPRGYSEGHVCNKNLYLKPTMKDVDFKPTLETVQQQPRAPAITKYRPPFWAYDSVEPHVIISARSLFFERKKQQAVYEAFPTWNNPSGAPRIPTDYELFAAWASLSKSDKMAYISEVNSGVSANLFPRNTLETQRAVSVLYASCPHAITWPSFQYSRAQAQPPPPRPHPLLVNSILPYSFDPNIQ